MKAEESKKRKMQDEAAQTSMPFAQNTSAGAELSRIFPSPVLDLLVDDFFTYIHPLAPLPHEPSYRAAMEAEDAFSNPETVALTASMIAVLVASFPRRPKMILETQGLDKMYASHVDLVDHCIAIGLQARGTNCLDAAGDLTVYQGIISYFFALSLAYTVRLDHSRFYFAEALTIVRLLGAQKADDPSFNPVRLWPIQTPVARGDAIQKELGRRLFWVIFIGVR